jgi:hypothetical protein
MHNSGFCDERVSGSVDAGDKIDWIAACYCVRSVGWKRGSQCALCSLHGKCHISVLRQVPTECSQDEGDPERKCCGRCCSRVWKPNWRRAVFVGGDVELLSTEDDVEKLLLCFGGYGGVGCKLLFAAIPSPC